MVHFHNGILFHHTEGLKQDHVRETDGAGNHLFKVKSACVGKTTTELSSVLSLGFNLYMYVYMGVVQKEVQNHGEGSERP